jgi:hypothetical protein
MKNLQGCRLRKMKTKLRNLLIDPKSDSSVSKVVQQLSCWIEAPQWSKSILKRPLRKVGARICE